jgi:phenylalanyl-tRNA synthetase beta chain
MKVSYNWLKQYLELNQSPEEMAEILTNTGLEVESVEAFSSVKGGLQGLIVGEVVEKQKHPNADKLSIAKVDVGGDKLLNIVCGAANLEQGQKVVVAGIDTTIYPTNGEPFTIKQAKLRGEPSEGMICAEDEIGLGTAHDGIMVLDKSVPKGKSVASLFDVENDFVFEIGLTPNRTDAMSHIGVARDIAAAINAKNNSEVKIQLPTLTPIASKVKSEFIVKVENSEACPRYSGLVINNISIKESPSWLKNRLLAVGVRPINNVVDITNYVLKEFGQALHAFDLKAITGNKIIVKTLEAGTLFKTLDGVERKLKAEDLMICNSTEPMCIAGVFGGAHSGVTNDTTSIFLESAYFDSAYIRKTSTSHDLRTDAAQRYEKGADPAITIDALLRAVELIADLAGGIVASPLFDIYPKEIKALKVEFRFEKLNKLAGVVFDKTVVKQILKDLDFEIKTENADNLMLIVPLYRADVTREADVIEEIMRIYGFNNIAIPSRVKSTLSFQQGINPHQLKEKIAHTLNGFGFSEIMTNSISQSKYYAKETDLVRLQNSMTSELDIMRASLLPEALNVLSHNINRKRSNLKLYEFGHIYKVNHKQEEKLAIYFTGTVLESNWIAKKELSSIFHLKGIVESLLSSLGIVHSDLELTEDQYIVLSKNKKAVAKIWTIDEGELAKFDVKQEVYCAELNWDYLLKLVSKRTIRFEELSKFPEVSRDLAVILDESIKFDSIFKKIKSSSGAILKRVDLFDVFVSKEKIGEHKKSYALNFKLQDPNKTLTDKEIDKEINNIIKTLEQSFDATIRK